MKKINLLLMIVIFTFAACKKEILLENPNPLLSAKSLNKQSSRPLNPGDPNLDATWDWTQPSWTAYFNNANGTVGSVTTLNPFIDGSQKIYGSVDVSKADMYPANGWMLVSKDFGTPSQATAYPFITLYNKYRGVLRVCVLRTYDVLSSYQQLTLSFANNSSYPNLFVYSPTFDSYNFSNSSLTKNSSYKQIAITFAGVQEWMIADFDVRGYSAVIDDNSAFNINVSEVSQSDIVLNGNIILDGSAQPQASGQSTLGQVNKVVNFLTKTSEGIAKVTNLPVNMVETKMAGGVEIFLRSILDLVSGFSSGSSSVPYSIKLKGTTNQTGSITLTSPKKSFSIYLKPTAVTPAYKALQNIPWGVFKIDNIVTISDEITPFYTWVLNQNGMDYSEVLTSYQRDLSLASNFITNSNFVINPAIAGDVSSIEFLDIIEYGDNALGLVTFQRYYSNFEALANYQANSRVISSYNSNIINFGVKITFNNGIVIYQEIPF